MRNFLKGLLNVGAVERRRLLVWHVVVPFCPVFHHGEGGGAVLFQIFFITDQEERKLPLIVRHSLVEEILFPRY